MNKIIRVALIGPESSGKTTLAEKLATHFQTNWVPEYSRDYISKLNRPYTEADIIHCTEKQLESEAELIKHSNKIIFSDTELIIAKVWMLDVFNHCPEWVENAIEQNKFDLYLLTKPDILFADDPVRENPLRREYFYNWYKHELDEMKFNYHVIEGDFERRISEAIDAVEILLNRNKA